MDKPKHFNDILALGKLIAEELALKPTDTLGRWMTHHISELIAEVEKSFGPQKVEAEERCREAILALWKHINVFPINHRPLENIEPLIATIHALVPENQAYFYQSEAMSIIKESSLGEESKSWLELAQGIDYSARLLVKECLTKVANDIKSDKKDWFDLAKFIDTDISATHLVRILSAESSLSDEELKIESVKKTIEMLKDRLHRLEAFLSMSEAIKLSISSDIQNMQQLLTNAHRSDKSG